MSRFFQRLIFVLGAAVFAALCLGFGLGEIGWFGVHAGGEQEGAYNQIHVYQQVLRRIQSDYVTEPNMQTVTTGALHGLLESLDADSSYLTPTEYKLLYHLVRNAGRVLTHGTLLAKVWGREYVDEVDYIRVYVRRLRDKLGDDPEHPRYIRTERGLGYRFIRSTDQSPHRPRRDGAARPDAR